MVCNISSFFPQDVEDDVDDNDIGDAVDEVVAKQTNSKTQQDINQVL